MYIYTERKGRHSHSTLTFTWTARCAIYLYLRIYMEREVRSIQSSFKMVAAYSPGLQLKQVLPWP